MLTVRVTHQIPERREELSLLTPLFLIGTLSLQSHSYKCLMFLSLPIVQVLALSKRSPLCGYISPCGRGSLFINVIAHFNKSIITREEHEAIAHLKHVQHLKIEWL